MAIKKNPPETEDRYDDASDLRASMASEAEADRSGVGGAGAGGGGDEPPGGNGGGGGGGQVIEVVDVRDREKDAERAWKVANKGVGKAWPRTKPHDVLFRRVRNLESSTQGMPKTDGIFTLTPDTREVISIYGIMLRGNVLSPDLGSRFKNALALARQEYLDNKALYGRTLDVLVVEGAPAGGRHPQVKARSLAAVVKSLMDDGVGASDINFNMRVVAALAASTGVDDGGPASAIDITLPDLEAQTDVGIVKANLDAMQAIYFAATLEEVRMFEVTDKLVELFNQGVLPLGRGNGGDLIFKYWKKSIERMTEIERRNLYSRSFGWPGGEAQPSAVNREFNDLWLRFASAVQSFRRQNELNQLLTAPVPGSVNKEQVRKSGRDLAANLSLYGYGMAYFAATELQAQIKDVIEILSNDDVKSCYGARDMWQVVDQVATLELGGARNSVRYRTMAQSGAVMIRWLGNNAARLAAVGVFDLDPNAPASGKATTEPSDGDLFDACEQWLAVTGTPDQRVEQFAQPSEAPNQTSRPIQIPSVARDLLDSAGLDGVSASLN